MVGPLPILTAGMKGTHSLFCTNIDLGLTGALDTDFGIKFCLKQDDT